MARYAIKDAKGVVVNVIEWDGDEWQPPQGCAAVRDDKAEMPAVDRAEDAPDDMTALKARVAALEAQAR